MAIRARDIRTEPHGAALRRRFDVESPAADAALLLARHTNARIARRTKLDHGLRSTRAFLGSSVEFAHFIHHARTRV
jgi:hypothetical protein